MQECVGQNKFTSSDSDAIRTFQIFSDVMTKQSIDPTQELTRSEIDSREIDLVLFIASHQRKIRLVFLASHPYCTDSGPPVTLFPIGTCGGA